MFASKFADMSLVAGLIVNPLRKLTQMYFIFLD